MIGPQKFQFVLPLENTGISEIWGTIKSYNEHITSSKVESRK